LVIGRSGRILVTTIEDGFVELVVVAGLLGVSAGRGVGGRITSGIFLGFFVLGAVLVSTVSVAVVVTTRARLGVSVRESLLVSHILHWWGSGLVVVGLLVHVRVGVTIVFLASKRRLADHWVLVSTLGVRRRDGVVRVHDVEIHSLGIVRVVVGSLL